MTSEARLIKPLLGRSLVDRSAMPDGTISLDRLVEAFEKDLRKRIVKSNSDVLIGSLFDRLVDTHIQAGSTTESDRYLSLQTDAAVELAAIQVVLRYAVGSSDTNRQLSETEVVQATADLWHLLRCRSERDAGFAKIELTPAADAVQVACNARPGYDRLAFQKATAAHVWFDQEAVEQVIPELSRGKVPPHLSGANDASLEELGCRISTIILVHAELASWLLEEQPGGTWPSGACKAVPKQEAMTALADALSDIADVDEVHAAIAWCELDTRAVKGAGALDFDRGRARSLSPTTRPVIVSRALTTNGWHAVWRLADALLYRSMFEWVRRLVEGEWPWPLDEGQLRRVQQNRRKEMRRHDGRPLLHELDVEQRLGELVGPGKVRSGDQGNEPKTVRIEGVEWMNPPDALALDERRNTLWVVSAKSTETHFDPARTSTALSSFLGPLDPTKPVGGYLGKLIKMEKCAEHHVNEIVGEIGSSVAPSAFQVRGLLVTRFPVPAAFHERRHDAEHSTILTLNELDANLLNRAADKPPK